MNAKAFFASSLSSALDLHVATAEDVMRHTTPDALAAHLPRPLWARLLTACVGAPRVDAQLVVETIGVPNLCEHLPDPLVWACMADIAGRALGQPAATPPALIAPAPAPALAPLAPPPPPPPHAALLAPMTPPSVGPSIPAPTAGAGTASDDDDGKASSSRRPPAQRFRPGIGRPATNAGVVGRRPQAVSRRATTEGAEDLDAGGAPAIDVDDDQLVDWSSQEETAAGEDERKR